MTDGPEKFHLFLDQSNLVTNAPKIFTGGSALEPVQTIDLLLHGYKCRLWSEPKSLAGWRVLELTATKDGDGYTEWSCPACGEVVVWRKDWD